MNAEHSRRLHQCLAHTKTCKIPPTSFTAAWNKFLFQKRCQQRMHHPYDQENRLIKHPEQVFHTRKHRKWPFKGFKRTIQKYGSGSWKTNITVAAGTADLNINKSTLDEIDWMDAKKRRNTCFSQTKKKTGKTATSEPNLRKRSTRLDLERLDSQDRLLTSEKRSWHGSRIAKTDSGIFQSSKEYSADCTLS